MKKKPKRTPQSPEGELSPQQKPDRFQKSVGSL